MTPDAGGVAALARDAAHGGALHHAALGDEQQLLVLAHDERAGEVALVLGGLDRPHAHRAALGLAELVDARALAEAGVRDHEQVLVVARDVHREDEVARAAATFMPRTPVVSRPIERTSDSWKRTAWPARETISTSSSPEVRRTATSSSSSRTLMAMMPSALIGVL